MRKIFVLLFSVFLLSGCSDSEFKGLVQQAETHYNNAEYDSALEVYNKALAVKEDVDVRKTTKDLESEVAKIKEVVKLNSEILDISTALKGITKDSQLVNLSEELITILLKIEDMDASGGLPVDRYIEKMADSLDINTLNLKAARFSLIHSTGTATSDAYTDGVELSGGIKQFVEAFPLPYGFASFK